MNVRRFDTILKLLNENKNIKVQELMEKLNVSEATINRNSITINFTVKYCNNAESLLDSDGFKRVLTAFIEKIEKKEYMVVLF